MNGLQLSHYESLAVVDSSAERMRAGMLEAILRDIDDAPRTVAAIEAAAARHPELTVGTLKRRYYAWKRSGMAALVDQRRLRRLTPSHRWAECYMTYCEDHNRSNKGAWRAMMEDFRTGVRLPHLGDWRDVWRIERRHQPLPPACPPEWIPKSARYETLQRSAKKNPDYGFQILASRQGRSAAHAHLLPVLRTRVGLEVGQVYEYDDVHIDAEIVMPGIGKVARPQFFVGYDIASGYQSVQASRPQFPETATGKRNSLKEREFRMMFAWQLTGVGIHPDGSRHIVEHGTTAIRPALERRIQSIPVFGALVTIERPGILAEAVHAGMWKGDGGGNFRIKAYCEQMHRTAHIARGLLPGQIGQDAAHRPEGHAALVRYDRRMMAAVETLPEEWRERIAYGLCDWPTFLQAQHLLMDRVMDEREHQLEGWGDRMRMVWRLSDRDGWRPISDLDDIAGDERDAILAYLRAHPENRAILRMSRREVWHAGARNLVRVPMYELPMMLDPSDAVRVRVRPTGTIAFRDQFYYGPDEMVYHATCITRTRFHQALVPGREYLLYATPYHQDGAIVVDASSGSVIGLAPLYQRAPIADRDAILRAAGAQNADLARKLMPVRGRHQAEAEARMQMVGSNADTLRAAAAASPATARRLAGRDPLGDGPLASIDDLTADAPDGDSDGDPADFAADPDLAFFDQAF